jgi:hypothetical protein
MKLQNDELFSNKFTLEVIQVYNLYENYKIIYFFKTRTLLKIQMLINNQTLIRINVLSNLKARPKFFILLKDKKKAYLRLGMSFRVKLALQAFRKQLKLGFQSSRARIKKDEDQSSCAELSSTKYLIKNSQQN